MPQKSDDTIQTPQMPSIESVEAELVRVRRQRGVLRTVRNVVLGLLVVAAAAVLVAMLVLPVLQITGTSMSDTLQDGDIVFVLRGTECNRGDIVALYSNNNVLVKRVIATEGQWVNITADGTVYVDDVALDEPYVTQKSLGECDIQLPYQVPAGRVFVMGDHRSTSVDSRSTSLGSVSTEMVMGRVVFRIWPLLAFGSVA